MTKPKQFYLRSLVGLALILLVLILYFGQGRKTDTVLTPVAFLTPENTETPTIEMISYQYGIHYPNGIAAVDYIFSSDGMWKEMNPIEYTWNYYEKCAVTDHPFGKSDLIAAANGTRFFTARDANCHLLLDWNQDGELDTTTGGYAFHEHNGVGINDQAMAPPLTVFWFDDNLLASFMTKAYNRPTPDGLSDFPDFTRWEILGFNNNQWTPYPESDYIDQIALNGLNDLSMGDTGSAIQKWNRILLLSGSVYDQENLRYVYPNILESYHLGLFEILTGFLMDVPTVDASRKQEIISHWVSLRSNILSYQETSGTRLLGWRSNVSDPNSLINTESIAINVLGLGAGAIHVLEAGQAPLQIGNNTYLLQPFHVVSAVKGVSTPGYLTLGPGQYYPLGTYAVDFFLHASNPLQTMATIDVLDAQTNQVLVSQDILASAMVDSKDWTRVTLNFTATNSDNRLEFRTYWHGTADMDIAVVRVRIP
jgi:hypothetical protein